MRNLIRSSLHSSLLSETGQYEYGQSSVWDLMLLLLRLLCIALKWCNVSIFEC